MPVDNLKPSPSPLEDIGSTDRSPKSVEVPITGRFSFYSAKETPTPPSKTKRVFPSGRSSRSYDEEVEPIGQGEKGKHIGSRSSEEESEEEGRNARRGAAGRHTGRGSRSMKECSNPDEKRNKKGGAGSKDQEWGSAGQKRSSESQSLIGAGTPRLVLKYGVFCKREFER